MRYNRPSINELSDPEIIFEIGLVVSESSAFN